MEDTYNNYTVKVSFFDPLGVFDAIRPELDKLLPLNAVYWKTDDGVLRSIGKLPVEFIPAVEEVKDDLLQDKPLIFMINVTCSSVNEYRNKVRPLIRRWVPATDAAVDIGEKFSLPSEYVILFHSNSEVLDSNLFKSVSLIEKLNKDFPSIKVIESKTIYKNDKEKQDFWNSTMSFFKNTLLTIFQRRLGILETELNSKKISFEKALILEEKILYLYLSFRIYDKAIPQLRKISSYLTSEAMSELTDGDIEVPFSVPVNGIETICESIQSHTLTKYSIYKYILVHQLLLSEHSVSPMSSTHAQLQIAREFYMHVKAIFEGSKKLLQFNYFYLECLLNRISSNKDDICHETYAALLLHQRDCWLKLVYANTNFRIETISFPPTSVVYEDDKLKNTYETEDMFQKTFIEKTSYLLDSFKKCSRKHQRMMDWLTVQKCTLYCQRGEYNIALDLLKARYGSHIDLRWRGMGRYLLELYVKCIKNLPSLENLELDGGKLPVRSVLRNCFLDLLVLSPDSKLHWWKEFQALPDENENQLIYLLDNVFKVEISGKTFLSQPNTYALTITVLNNVIPGAVNVSSIKLLLKNAGGDLLVFTASEITIAEGSNSIILEATDVKFSTFEFISLEITVGNTTFSKSFEFEPSRYLTLQELYCKENFNCLISMMKRTVVNDIKLHLEIKNKKSVNNFSLQLTAIRSGIKDNKSAFSFSKTDLLHTLTINDMNVEEIPYFLKYPIDNIRLGYDLQFEKNGLKYRQRHYTDIEVRLPLSVTVGDIFKRDCFYFKFMVSACSNFPIALYSCYLDQDDSSRQKYVISDGFKPERAIILRPNTNDLCSNIYKIQVKDNLSYKQADSFKLVVEYYTAKQILDRIVTEIFLRDFLQSNKDSHELWSEFWRRKVLPQVIYDYSHFGEMKLVKILGTSQQLLSFIKTEVYDTGLRDQYCIFIKTLTSGIEIPPELLKNLPSDGNILTVPVSLPHIKHLFYVELKPEFRSHYAFGEIIPMELRVSNLSYKWGINDADATYILKVFNTSDWAINGKRRAVIESAEVNFNIQIIPLRRGDLPYPKVEIYTSDKIKVDEVDYLNSYETVLVV
ncbi:HBL334Wp [Eremothecium sinecaudum]|uniref:HBL334Wp n=1 Tax=Eremothecium sinecaudum TaxID=45286 RepID=A0A109UVZ8_9SACH|nr:HBL334Wp [Eremothecium sinecaudum]AMD18568.1 HBL334Wp [Eremothecium sinecaudum]